MIHTAKYDRNSKKDTSSFTVFSYEGKTGAHSTLYIHSHLIDNHSIPSLKITILSVNQFKEIAQFKGKKPNNKILAKNTAILNKLKFHSIHTKTVRYDDFSYTKTLNSIYIPFEFFNDNKYPDELKIGIEYDE